MTDILIKKQIEAIKATGSKARESKESALRFLVDAGLLAKRGKNIRKDSLATIKSK